MSREVTHRYEDPLDAIWRRAAAGVGLTVRRSAVCYAATDGRGTLLIGEDDTLDPDDCLAQMIFHELCHSLVEGPESFERADWGLDNETPRDRPKEHACLRVQAWLAGHHGLRRVLAPTTEHRAFYDALGADPLRSDDRADPSVPLARRAAVRARRPPWAPHLQAALQATGAIARVVASAAAEITPRPGRPEAERASLWARAEHPSAPHPTGLPAHPDPDGRTCAGCAWQRPAGPGPKVARCRQADDARVALDAPACERFEPALDCRRCGACCREAYEVVEVSRRDPFVTRHADLIERIDGRLTLRRVDGRCPPLIGDGSPGAPFTCRVYAERPRTCRDFERGGAHCLDARRCVGLSL